MEYLEIIIKLIIGLGVLNVWLLRARTASTWRGGGAASLHEEFQAYGFSETVMKFVGVIKIVLAVLILISIFYAPLEIPTVSAMAVMMLAAVVMHIKIKDPFKRSLPALTLLALSVIVLLI